MKKAKPPQRSRSFSWKFLFVFFICIFSFLAIFSSGTIESEDGWLYLNVARNVYYHHQFTAPPRTEYPDLNVNMNTVQAADGTWRAPGSTGYSLAMVPAVALSDIIHRYYQSPPPEHFPLQSDWTLLFFASFTNIFFAALLAVLLLLYGQRLGWSRKEAVVFSLLTIFSTNIFSTSKFGFAQTMFTFFIVLTFYLIKKYVEKRTLLNLGLIIISFILLAISYNETFFLTVPAMTAYYLILIPEKQRKTQFLILVGIGLVGSIAIFKHITYLLSYLIIPPKILFEGIWGFLFSSGKSAFLYSPLLLIIPMFWHKIKKNIYPELIGFGVLTVLFLIMIGGSWITNPLGRTPIWNGGMSWGPRYFVPLIPGLMIIVFSILLQFSKLQKRFIAYPLITFGIFIQLMGVSALYLLQYTDIPFRLYIGQDELSVYDYASFIPRYSPVWKMPHVIASLAYYFPQTVLHGPYDVRFYDGFDIPFHPGRTTFRGFREEGHISLSEKNGQKPRDISLVVTNAPDTITASESATVLIKSKDTVEKSLTLPINVDTTVSLDATQLHWSDKTGYLDLAASYTATPSAPHVIYIKSMNIDGIPTNLGSIDYPDASTLNQKFTPIEYQYYGGKVTDPWKLWNLRARINERTFDFWWVKNLYYWDRLQILIWIFFAADLSIFGMSFIYLVLNKKEFDL